MKHIKQVWQKLAKDERGLSVVEGFLYTAVAAGITYAAVTLLGGSVKEGATSLGTSIESKMTPLWD